MDQALLQSLIDDKYEGKMLKADGFDDAIIGIAHKFGMYPVLVYDIEKMIEIMVRRDTMTHDEAEEYFEYNIHGAYVGEHAPIYMERIG